MPLIFIVYYRLYTTSSLTGVLFKLDQNNVPKDLRKLEPHLKTVLPTPTKLHDKLNRLQTQEEIKAIIPEFKAFIDATEQEIPRSKNKRKQQTHFRGKKKRHTVKTQLTVNEKTLSYRKRLMLREV